MPGNFFWYELMTTDIDAAKKFYEAVVGWTAQAAPGAGSVQYTQFLVNGRGIGGMLAKPEDARKAGMPNCWSGYVRVDDADKAAAKIESLGGKVYKPIMEVPGIIRFAIVADPQGAGFIVAKPLMPDTFELPVGTPGTAGWRELFATDGKAAFGFYETMFGWTKGDAVDMGPMGAYQLFKTGGADAVGGMMTKPPHVPVPHWGYYFNVSAIDAAAARVTAAGGKVLNGPMQVPGGQWIVQCVDPQAAAFNLVAPKR